MWNFFKKSHKSDSISTFQALKQEENKKETPINTTLPELNSNLSYDLKQLKEPLTEISYEALDDEKLISSIQSETKKIENKNDKDNLQIQLLIKEYHDLSNEIPKEKYFYSHDGKLFKSLKEFYENIYNLSDDAFNIHVENNDFVNWLRDVFKDYEAYQLLLFARTKERYSNLLKELIEKREFLNQLNIEEKEDKKDEAKENKQDEFKDELKNYDKSIENIISRIDKNLEETNLKILNDNEKNEDFSKLNEKIEVITFELNKLQNNFENMNQKQVNSPTKEEISNLSSSLDIVFNQYAEKINLELSDIKKRNEETSITKEKIENITSELKKIKDKFENIPQKQIGTPTKEELLKLSQGLDLVLRISKKDKEEYDKTLSGFKNIQDDIKGIKNQIFSINDDTLKKDLDIFKKTTKEQIDTKLKNYESMIFRLENQTKILSNQNISTLKQLKEELTKVKDMDSNLLNLKAKTADFTKTDSLEIISKRIDKLEEENKIIKDAAEYLENDKNVFIKHTDETIKSLKEEIKKARDSDANMLNIKAHTANFAKVETQNEIAKRVDSLEEKNNSLKELIELLNSQKDRISRNNEEKFDKFKAELYQNIKLKESNKNIEFQKFKDEIHQDIKLIENNKTIELNKFKEILNQDIKNIKNEKETEFQKFKIEVFQNLKNLEQHTHKENNEVPILKKQLNDEFLKRIKHLEEYNLRFKEAILLLEKQNISLKNKNNNDFKELKEEIYQKLSVIDKYKLP